MGKEWSLKQKFSSDVAYDTFVNHAVTEINASLPAGCPRATGIGTFHVEHSHIAVYSSTLSHGEANCEVTISLDRESWTDKFKAGSVLRSGQRN